MVTHNYFKGAYMKLLEQVQVLAINSTKEAGSLSESYLKFNVGDSVPQPNQRDAILVMHLANGLHSKEIGERMELSYRTIENLTQDARYKYHAKTSAQLVAIFIRNGWIK